MLVSGKPRHDATLNQFYEEAQFESYRALGYEIANRMSIEAGLVRAGSTEITEGAKDTTLEQMIERLRPHSA